MTVDTDSPSRAHRNRINRRTLFGLLAALIVMVVSAAAYRWYRMDSAFDRCIGYLQQIEVGMSVTAAVGLMDQARPDNAPISKTPENMIWQISCSRDDGCDEDGLQCWLATMLYGWENQAEFAVSSDGTDITAIGRESCRSFGGDSMRCTSP